MAESSNNSLVQQHDESFSDILPEDLDPVSPETADDEVDYNNVSNNDTDNNVIKSTTTSTLADVPTSNDTTEVSTTNDTEDYHLNDKERTTATADDTMKSMEVDETSLPEVDTSALNKDYDNNINSNDIEMMDINDEDGKQDDDNEDDNDNENDENTSKSETVNDKLRTIAEEQNNTNDKHDETNTDTEKEQQQQNDESMDQDEIDKPEEINMENVEEQEKDKSTNIDPFDSLMNDSNIDNSKRQDKNATANNIDNNEDDDDEDRNADNEGGAGIGSGDSATGGDGYADDDDDHDHDHDKHQNDTNDNRDDEAAVDDISEGKGIDEEISLLPDAEREISDADKEKARLAKEAADKDDPEHNDQNADDDDDDVITVEDEPIEENDDNDKINDDIDLTADGADLAQNLEQQQYDALQQPLKEGEIKEIQSDLPEKICMECNTTRLVKYSLLVKKDNENAADKSGAHEENETEEDHASADSINEIKYLCDIDCVDSYRSKHPDIGYTLTLKKILITQIIDTLEKCLQCTRNKACKYRMQNADKSFEYLCEEQCLLECIGTDGNKYFVKRKRYVIEEITVNEQLYCCMYCNEMKKCRFNFKHDDDDLYVCEESCLNLLMKEQPERFRIKRRSVRVRDLPKRNVIGLAALSELTSTNAAAVTDGTISATTVTTTTATTDTTTDPSNKILARTQEEADAARNDREESFTRRCGQCYSVVTPNERSLHWEAMDFCNETCLGQYQNVIGAACTTCQNAVTLTSLGKYCVRFGFEIRQFCRAACLDQFKKGLKVCSYCQQDITKTNVGFLAPVQEQFKDFCSQICLKKYEEILNPKRKSVMGLCSVCNNEKTVRVKVLVDGHEHVFCSNPCFSAFRFVNNIYPDQCSMCTKHFERKSSENYTIYQDNVSKLFCSKFCLNIFIIANRKIVPCEWCKVKKYNFDMIQKFSGASAIMLCSLNCLTLCEVSMNAISRKRLNCDQCQSLTTPQYHLAMSDSTIRNFCTYQCVMAFQSQFSRAPLTFEDQSSGGDGGANNASGNSSPVPTGVPKRIKNLSNIPSKTPTTSIATNCNSKSKTTAASTSKLKAIAPKSNKAFMPNASQLLSKTTITMSGNKSNSKVPIISNVQSLASGIATRSSRTKPNAKEIMDQISSSLQPVVELEQIPQFVLKKVTSHGSATPPARRSSSKLSNASYDSDAMYTQPAFSTPRATTPQPPKIEYKTQIVTLPPIPKPVCNMSTMCAPRMESVGIDCKPNTREFECQTESILERKIIIPIPVPIYIPQPMYMYSQPFPVPVPIPLPIPVPIFIPTTRNSAEGIMKEIKKIQDKMPTDPFEAELLMMAEMVAGDKKKNDSDSGTEDEAEEDYTNDATNVNNSFGEDVLQIALKMATEFEPAVDLESAMQANTITPNSHPHSGVEGVTDEHNQMLPHHHQLLLLEQQRQAQLQQQGGAQRGRKRNNVGAPRNNNNNNNRNVQAGGIPVQQPPQKRARRQDIPQLPPQPEPPREPAEKADANMCLKFTFGVNAWKQWVITKNADLEKSSIRRKPFKSELLQLTADELNYSLCLFVKEVRKPNGSEYAPDTIYYLVLGIQQYLYENGRIDNIFTDTYYEKFTDCLDDVAKKFSVLYNDSHYIVTRVEEEHLWECKQLGAHSPHVLLSTLMFFNTKHFNLTTVEEHMQLSFSHIMKHWKRNPNQVGQAKLPGSRNVLLRFYPPQLTLENNSKKKKVYEQQENEENPLRCPVKLYEFYLSKCPESVKTRNDVFYLQPERSCVPDSPVWYSTQALGRESLCKMLHRVKMVKEINIALLTS